MLLLCAVPQEQAFFVLQPQTFKHVIWLHLDTKMTFWVKFQG